ncbi:hypothetical protein ABZ351_18175 [Streptomyces microflavus]|uniref:hypothetical protein n=1 Tax=Streptomyces microflavus TaxID=1919 RepID=UPI0033C491EB
MADDQTPKKRPEPGIYVRGEGGQVIGMDLPLPESVADRLAAGTLRRVNKDGTPYGGTYPVALDGVPYPGDPAPDRESALTAGRTPRPADRAPKAEWVAWAVGVHGYTVEEAEELTKGALQDLPEVPHVARPGEPPQSKGSGQPSESADKAEWIAYVVRQGHLSADDAATLTKADLIDLVK